MSSPLAYRIIAFDGVCNLCNSTVNWIIDNDPKGKFKFIALQNTGHLKALGIDLNEFGVHQNLNAEYSDGNSKSDVLKDTDSGDDHSSLHSVYLIEEGNVYQKSTAVLRVCRQLSGLYPLLYLYIIIPRPIRDFVYDIIAQNRYKWFGKRAQCRVPTPELKDRFL